ncbi:7155_t:CDS:2, partial [Cetraspora pellucida]
MGSEGEGNIAEGIYRTVIQANRRAGWAWKRLGFAELAKGNYSEAITDFQTALRTDTKDIRCWEGLAEAYRHEGRYMASLKAFLRATELDPSSVYAHYKIAT